MGKEMKPATKISNGGWVSVAKAPLRKAASARRQPLDRMIFPASLSIIRPRWRRRLRFRLVRAVLRAWRIRQPVAGGDGQPRKAERCAPSSRGADRLPAHGIRSLELPAPPHHEPECVREPRR